MFKNSTRCLAAALAAGGLVMGPACLWAGEGEGVSRISDAAHATAANAPAYAVQAGSSVMASHAAYSGYDFAGYGHPYDACNTNCYCDACMKGWGKKGWLFKPGYCSYAADHGWAVPRKNSIRRAGVEYQAYWPHEWYGLHSARAAGTVPPVVGMPTDTTQLGYYYQHVPQWRPVPGMIPPPPDPAMFHDRTVYPQGVNASAHQWLPATTVEPVEVEPAPVESIDEPPVPPAPGVSTANRVIVRPIRD